MISDTINDAFTLVLPLLFDDPMFTVDVDYQRYDPTTKTYTGSGTVKALDLGLVNAFNSLATQNYMASQQTAMIEQVRSIFLRNEDIPFDMSEEDAVRDRIQIGGKNSKINKIEPVLGTLTYVEINQ